MQKQVIAYSRYNYRNAVKLVVLSFFLSALFINTLQAQEQEKLWEVITNDENRYVGTIPQQTEDTVTMKTQQLGLIRIPRASIHTIRELNADPNSKFSFKNHHSTRYFFAPNAFGLRKGEGYYQNNWVLFNQASVGLTDYFTLGVGTIPLFLFGGISTPVWVTPKISFPINEGSWHTGIGALAGTVIGESITYGITYWTNTFGNENSNMTIGLGYGFAEGDFSNSPTISLAGMHRVTDRTYLLTENYWFTNGGGLFTLGGRTAWRLFALDYGLVIPSQFFEGETPLIAIPWLGVSIPFGGKEAKKKKKK